MPKSNIFTALGLMLSVILVGIVVALTYHIFEGAVHQSISAIWYTWLNTDSKRILVVPTGIILTLAYFGLQHVLDVRSETHEEHGLGNMPAASLANYGKVLLIGFFSLVAGATLGPEAILVPASMIAGSYIGLKLYKDNDQAVKLLAAAAIIALFTAFFNSFIVGVLSLALVTKQAQTKVTPLLVIIAGVAAAASLITLTVVSGKPFFDFPHYDWDLSVLTILCSALTAAIAYVAVLGMAQVHKQFEKVRALANKRPWWIHGLIAGIGLMALYLIGGPLVEFTGNKSIVPMFDQATTLGLWGLIWVLVIKIIAMSWSKAIGYRGGMIFPTIFLVSVIIAIIQLYQVDFNMVYGMIAGIAGALAANRKNHILV